MHCTVCGQETGSMTESRCKNCRPEPDVQILTPEEREKFHGVTIDSDGGRQDDGQQRHSTGTGQNQGVYIRQVSFGSGGGLISKIVIAAIIAAIIFFVLPLALFVAGGLALFWLLYRLLFR